jgi:hypothetical protein
MESFVSIGTGSFVILTERRSFVILRERREKGPLTRPGVRDRRNSELQDADPYASRTGQRDPAILSSFVGAAFLALTRASLASSG